MNDRTPRIFVSYKTGSESGITFQARTIAEKLASPEFGGYDVWMDVADIEAGLDWNAQIYDHVPKSDVVLLLMAKETRDSDWVRREIDVAKGAKVTILPVLIRGDFDLQETLDRLDIPRVQALSLLTGSDKEYQDLIAAIEQRKDETCARQLEWLNALRQGDEEIRVPSIPARSDLATFAMPEVDTTIYLAGGDVTELRDIDVFVNSENDYMQMARVFEGKTVSSRLRYRAAAFDAANRLVEDTLQNELNLLVEGPLGPRPVGKYAVLVTSAGHATGELRAVNHARFVFHAATVAVQGDGIDKYLETITTESGIRRTVKALLAKVGEVNEARGVVSPEATAQRAEQEEASTKYVPIDSIVIPLFGTGAGGQATSVVAPAVARGVKEFLLDTKETTLRRIHLCAFYEDQVEALRDALQAEFAAVTALPTAKAEAS